MPDPVTGLPVVGMVGAGQLARMTHQAAVPLGLSLALLAESPQDGAALVAPDVTVGDYRDLEDLRSFAVGCDVVTFDHEHVPSPHLRALAAEGTVLRPGPDALRYCQDKLAMRARLSALGVPVPAWTAATSRVQVVEFGAAHGWPVVVKAPAGGYDGRGVWVLSGPDADPLPALLARGPVLVEELVPLRRELAVQVARRPSGECRCWPVVETVQAEGICVEVVAPATDLCADLAAQAQRIATGLAESLDVTGVLAVELFERAEGAGGAEGSAGTLLVNELAMRPHNSGHWSIEGSTTSQFSQHLRAVLDWPLGATDPVAPVTVMVNLLGGPDPDLAARLPVALGAEPSVAVHLYGKRPRPGRKLGHATALGSDPTETRERARRAVAMLRGPG